MDVWFLDTVHPALQERLEGAGMTCHDGTSMTTEALIEQAHSGSPPVQGIVIRSRLTLDQALLSQLPQLEWIARSGSGLENIDTAWCQVHGILVHSSPEGNRDAVGEHTTGMLLSLLHKLHLGHASVRSGEWLREDHRGRELQHLTVGIIGYGPMGSAFAERLAGFGCSVLAYDKHKPGWGDHPTVDKPLPHVQPVGESTLREACDVVSLHLPWTQETSGLVDGPWLQSWQKPLILLNTSRGGIVQSKALVEALEKGTVLAAGLDVLEHEARSLESMGASNHEQRQTLEALLCDDRVMITPHVAGWTQESLVRLSTVLADKILAQGKT